MAENTKIEWCDHTFNPWVGCTKVSPACEHCYAESWAVRTGQSGLWAGDRRRTSPANWRLPLKWNRQAEADGVRRKVFCASLADVFDNAAERSWRAGLFRLILNTPHLDWLLLTKRIGNAAWMMLDAVGMATDCQHTQWPLPNVWLGATVVNQEEANRDIPKLLDTPAVVRFVSAEPLLGPLDLYGGDPDPRLGGVEAGPGLALEQFWKADGSGPFPGVDWVICGGESGPHARPMHPDWARSLRDQCQAAGAPFFFKQWGEWQIASAENGHFDCSMERNHAHWVGLDGRVEKPSAVGMLEPYAMIRVGKKRAGRLLDGRTWGEWPEAPHS